MLYLVFWLAQPSNKREKLAKKPKQSAQDKCSYRTTREMKQTEHWRQTTRAQQTKIGAALHQKNLQNKIGTAKQAPETAKQSVKQPT